MRALPAILMISITSRFGLGQTNKAHPFVALVNIPGVAANLPGVKGVAVDAAGNVFFASGGYNAYSVLRWDASTGLLTTAAGNGTPGYSGDNGPATSAQLDGATDVAVDRAGNLYIADSNNFAVRRVSNGIITTVAGGRSYPDCDNCPATASLPDLTAVATDSAGNLYIYADQRVRKVSNGVITELAGSGALFPNAGDFSAPGTVAVDSAGNVYLADPVFQRVLKVSNGVVTTVAGEKGAPGFSGDNGPASVAHLTGPRGVALDANGNLYIADTGNQRIRRVANGVITTVAGGGPTSGGLGDYGPATSALLNFPFGVAVDSAGNMYIEDTLDYRVRKVSNGVITTVAGGGSTPVTLAKSAGTFASTGNMSAPRLAHTATLLGSGKVLIAGGSTPTGQGSPVTPIATAELYDPAAGTFAATGSMAAALWSTTATLLADGRVLITGAPSSDFGSVASGEIYDPSNGAFTTTGSLLRISRPATATLLNNGKVLITGSSGKNPTSDSSFFAELYDPSTGTFTGTGDTQSRLYSTALLLPSGKVLVCSWNGSELYDPPTGTFSATDKNFSCGYTETLTLLANGQVLLAGGDQSPAVYDPTTGIFTATGGLAEESQTATLLPDQTVLITGGDPCSATDYLCFTHTVADAELYDPSTGTIGSAGMMTTVRDSHQATLLPDGRVLISGGATDSTPLSSAEIYTPSAPVPAPALFSLSGNAQGQGAIWHADTGQVASPDHPAAAGDVLSMYTTRLFEGGVIPPQVAVGGKLAEITFFGDAPGYPGYYQVNFRMPGSVAPGSAVAVRLTYIGRPSNEVTIGITNP